MTHYRNNLQTNFNRSEEIQSEVRSNPNGQKPVFGGCCGKETLDKSETSIWLKDKRTTLKPIPKYKEYQSPKQDFEMPGSPHRGSWDEQTINYYSGGKSN